MALQEQVKLNQLIRLKANPYLNGRYLCPPKIGDVGVVVSPPTMGTRTCVRIVGTNSSPISGHQLSSGYEFWYLDRCDFDIISDLETPIPIVDNDKNASLDCAKNILFGCIFNYMRTYTLGGYKVRIKEIRADLNSRTNVLTTTVEIDVKMGNVVFNRRLGVRSAWPVSLEELSKYTASQILIT